MKRAFVHVGLMFTGVLIATALHINPIVGGVVTAVLAFSNAARMTALIPDGKWSQSRPWLFISSHRLSLLIICLALHPVVFGLMGSTAGGLQSALFWLSVVLIFMTASLLISFT